MRTQADQSFAILTDTTLCTGCEACVAACKERKGLGQDVPRRWKDSIDDLSATRLTTIVRSKGDHYVRKHCRHCVEPACVSACLVGALRKTEEGPVIDDYSKCIGCRYCILSCPFGVPRYEWSERVPFMRKCDLCHDLLVKGGQPECTAACPEGATLFGRRGELIAEAQRRLTANPQKYVQRIYGKTDVGGTCVLTISDIPLDFLGWKEKMGETPLPKLTWASLKKVPPTILVVGGVMAATYWIIGRRMRLQSQAALAAAEESTAQDTDDGCDSTAFASGGDDAVK